MQSPVQQFSRFLASGGLATGIHFLLMWVLVQWRTEATVATAAGAASGAVTNYLLQRRWTFDCDQAHRETVPRFAALSLTSWALNQVLFTGLYQVMNLGAAPAQLLTTGLLTLMNFLVYRGVVFR